MPEPSQRWCFDRRELAGSLGDMGTLLPIAIGLILINGLDATAVFVTVGLFYLISGLYFRVTVPVQPMKIIGAYAITQLASPLEISTAGLWMGLILILLGGSGTLGPLIRAVPLSVVRGVQFTTGILLLTEGVRFILGQSALQTAQGAAEPFLSTAFLGSIPVGPIVGVVSVVLVLLLLENRVAPAALVLVALGATLGLVLGGYRELDGLDVGLHLPEFLPYGLPGSSEIVIALVALALPQLPMTIGNAVVAQSDLTRQYFGGAAADRSSPRALAISMGLANVATALVGGMPLCHGAGGLAAHYRFGARTAGSNLMIGVALVLIALLLGGGTATLLCLIPFAVLGALLVFAGAQLALTIQGMRERRDLFVIIVLLAVSLASTLAVGFVVGLVVALALKHPRLSV